MEAIEAAIDRETLVKVVFNNEYIAGNQWVQPKNYYYNSKFPVPKRDVAKARALATGTLAFPLAILLALGRRSRLPVVKGFCVVYIELVRGVPLISLLFMASVMLPLFLPDGWTIDKATEEAKAIGLRSEALEKFALDYIAAHKK